MPNTYLNGGVRRGTATQVPRDPGQPLDEGPALPGSLLGDQPQELGHRLVVNGSCQVGAGHAGHGQGLDGDDVVGGNNFGCPLMGVIQAGFPNLAVQDGNPDFGFGPVSGSFLLS